MSIDRTLSHEKKHLTRGTGISAASGYFDECIKSETRYLLGFIKPSPAGPFGHAGSFGMPGAGGSFGYADPQAGIGYGYVTNRMGVSLPFDPRDVALRTAIPSGGT